MTILGNSEKVGLMTPASFKAKLMWRTGTKHLDFLVWGIKDMEEDINGKCVKPSTFAHVQIISHL